MQAETVLFFLAGLLIAASPASALEAVDSASGSLDGADVPLCSQEELVVVGGILQKNTRKLQCQTNLKITELTTVKANETTTLDAMCDDQSCKKALEQLYTALPDCRYKDWAIKFNTERLLMQCGIDPSKLTASSGPDDDTSVGSAGSSSGIPAPTVDWGSSSGESTFAPIGTAPSPTTASPVQVPSPVSTSGVDAVSAVNAAVAAVVLAALTAF